MVKPDVKFGCVGDVTLTLIVRMKGKTLGERSRSSSLASSGIIWQPRVAALVGSEVSNPATIIKPREPLCELRNGSTMRDLLYRGRGGNCRAYHRKHKPCDTNYAHHKRLNPIFECWRLMGKSLSRL